MPRPVLQRRTTVMQRYAHFLAHHPFLILTLTFFGNIVLLLVIVCTDNLPTFDDPQAGFQPRGTVINQRTLAWHNFHEHQQAQTESELDSNGASLQADLPSMEEGDADYDTITKGPQISPLEEEVHTDPAPLTSLGPIREPRGFFCSDPIPKTARIILQRKDLGNLLDLASIREICSLDQTVRRLPEFQRMGERTSSGDLCQTWNLPNCLAALSKKASCQQLTQSDVNWALNLTASCLVFLRGPDGRLKDDCSQTSCRNIPAVCVKDSLIYHLLYFISDRQSLETNYASMKYTLALLPVRSGPAALLLFREMRTVNLTSQDGRIQLIAVEMELEGRLFDAVLLEDTLFMGIAAVVVVLVLWIYTTSLFVTLMNMLAIFFSLQVAYFLYVFVLRLTFPFMNLLTCIIIIAIGADALVIYARLWHLAKTEKNDGRFEKVVHATFRHASQAILVSSLTASAALFADIVNPIMAIRCFSIFAGLTVLVHFVFAMTWIPICFVIADKWSSSLYVCRFLPPNCCDTKSLVCRLLQRCRCLAAGLHHFFDYFRIFFEKLLPCLVIRLKWAWTVVFCALTVAACVVVLDFPGLQLASGRTFPLWNPTHPWEQYRLLKDRFAFEEDRSLNDPRGNFSLRFVWGVLAPNQAALLDPKDTGTLLMDRSFNLSDPHSQRWMLQFCADLKAQDFFDKNSADSQTSSCFIEVFKNWMDGQACDGTAVCCKNVQFPYPPHIFNKCSQTFLRFLAEQIQSRRSKHFGPHFNSLDQIDAFVMHCQSLQPFSHSFKSTQNFYRHVEDWFSKTLRTAPPGLVNGWFSGDFQFFDLQQSLINGTTIALIVSFFVALLVLFFTTLNVLVSLIAMIVVAGIMLATTAALVLMDWQLNVFESTIIGLAIGLSVDFTLHFAVSYCCAEGYEERELKTNLIIAEMASPVTMSAVTTFLAGAMMIPSEILFYRQIGVFIVVVISISLVYATIFFPACLAAFGPQGTFLQFHYPSCRPLCCRPDPSKLVEKSMHASTEFDTTVTSGRFERDREKQYMQSINQPYQSVNQPIKKSILTNSLVQVITATPEQPPENQLLQLDAAHAEEETDSVGELGSVPASRGPSRGASLIRRQGKGIFPWDYIMQKLPLTRHFSVAGSSVIYIDADVRSVTSDLNLDVPAVLPNIRQDIPEVWVRRTEV